MKEIEYIDERAIHAMESCGIPAYMRGGLIRFFNNGIEPGGFLSAVIDNDLRNAIGRADSTNRECIASYVQWLYNYAPARSWGFPGAVEKWLMEFHKEES